MLEMDQYASLISHVLSCNPACSQLELSQPCECHHSTSRECIGERLRAVPAHSERSAETIVIHHDYFRAIWIFECDIRDAAEAVRPNAICSWNNELTEVPNQVVIVRVAYVRRTWIDGHYTQAVGAASI